MSKYSTNKKAKSAAAGIVAMVLAFGLAAGYVGLSVTKHSWNPADWVIERDAEESQEDIGTGAIVVNSASNGIRVMASPFNTLDSGSETVASGSTAEVTVEYEPGYITTAKFDYALGFANPESVWASGKTVEDYMMFTPSKDGAASGTLTCKKPFAEEITLTATSRDIGGASGTISIGYISRPTITTNAALGASDFWDDADIGLSYALGEGTHEGEFSGQAVISVNEDFVQMLEQALSFDVTFKSFLFDNCATSSGKYITFKSASATTMKWDMFVNNFSQLTSEQKDELYYTWNSIWRENYGISDSIINVDYTLEYTYNGTKVWEHQETDLPCGYLTGESDAESVNLANVSVNGGGDILF